MLRFQKQSFVLAAYTCFKNFGVTFYHSFFSQDHLPTIPKPGKLHERPVGNTYVSLLAKVIINFNSLVKIGKESNKTSSPPSRPPTTRHYIKPLNNAVNASEQKSNGDMSESLRNCQLPRMKKN